MYEVFDKKIERLHLKLFGMFDVFDSESYQDGNVKTVWS